MTSCADQSKRSPATTVFVYGSTTMNSPWLSIEPRRQRDFVASNPTRFAARRARFSDVVDMALPLVRMEEEAGQSPDLARSVQVDALLCRATDQRSAFGVRDQVDPEGFMQMVSRYWRNQSTFIGVRRGKGLGIGQVATTGVAPRLPLRATLAERGNCTQLTDFMCLLTMLRSSHSIGEIERNCGDIWV